MWNVCAATNVNSDAVEPLTEAVRTELRLLCVRAFAAGLLQKDAAMCDMDAKDCHEIAGITGFLNLLWWALNWDRRRHD